MHSHSMSSVELDDYLKQVKVRIPYHVLRGEEDGPTLYVQACQHGTELNGWEAVRRAVSVVGQSQLRGTLIVVPIANPIAFQSRRHGFPTPARNMNRVWPGDGAGTMMPQRLAALLWENLVREADAAIDLHCWGDVSIPAAWTNPGNEAWILAFGTPFLSEAEFRPDRGMLQDACHAVDKPCCCLEMIPQNVIDGSSADLGRQGILNVLRYMGMLDGPMEYPQERYLCTTGPVDHLPTVSVEGMWVPRPGKGRLVRRGALLGRVYDWSTLEVREEIAAPADGLFYMDRPSDVKENANLVEPGTVVANVREVSRVLGPDDGPHPGGWRT